MPRTSSHFPKSSTALLIIDVINPLDFPSAMRFRTRALRTARTIAKLASRARRRRIPVIFVNDNLGRWRSDLDGLIEQVNRPGVVGAPLVSVLRPMKSDFVVLKSTLSGFHQTPLEAMLRLGNVNTLVLSGFVTGNCVLFTAADAYMRNFQLSVASDAVADVTGEEQRSALRTMKTVLKATIRPAAKLRLRR